jgi:hypothetical protein
MAFAFIVTVTSCGGSGGAGSGGGGSRDVGTPEGTSSVTVAAISGAITHTTTLSLSVQ